ncbi:MAG TPA: hypothetical protein VJ729_02080 [Nitrososphaeraceae archaeon]|nr:hypothetical protein [Nitrososphaeraceae archaeon]
MSPIRRATSARRIIFISVVVGLATVVLFVLSLALSYFIAPPAKITGSNNNNDNIQVDLQSANTSAANTPFVDIYGNRIEQVANANHAHAALMVFVNGKPLDFSSPKYQNLDLLMHFENNSGFILHKHARFAWLGPFFESLNMTFAQNCLTLDNDSSYCSNFNNQISFWVNGKLNDKFEHYSPNDRDRILITYGNKKDIQNQLHRLNSINITA